jgi:hypothetical protein
MALSAFPSFGPSGRSPPLRRAKTARLRSGSDTPFPAPRKYGGGSVAAPVEIALQGAWISRQDSI